MKISVSSLKKAQKTFCFLEDRYNTTIEYVEKLIYRKENLCYYTNNYDLNYERLENRINELIEELENACYKRFMLEYESCFDNDNQEDYFISFYSDARMEGDFYINEEFELFEHIEYERSFA